MIILPRLLQLLLEMSCTELFVCTSRYVKHFTFLFYNLEAMLQGDAITDFVGVKVEYQRS